MRFKVKGTVAAGTELTVSASASASKGGVPLTTIIVPSYTFNVAE